MIPGLASRARLAPLSFALRDLAFPSPRSPAAPPFQLSCLLRGAWGGSGQVGEPVPGAPSFCPYCVLPEPLRWISAPLFYPWGGCTLAAPMASFSTPSSRKLSTLALTPVMKPRCVSPVSTAVPPFGPRPGPVPPTGASPLLQPGLLPCSSPTSVLPRPPVRAISQPVPRITGLGVSQT